MTSGSLIIRPDRHPFTSRVTRSFGETPRACTTAEHQLSTAASRFGWPPRYSHLIRLIFGFIGPLYCLVTRTLADEFRWRRAASATKQCRSPLEFAARMGKFRPLMGKSISWAKSLKRFRSGPESNRHTRICSPLHHHSATGPEAGLRTEQPREPAGFAAH